MKKRFLFLPLLFFACVLQAQTEALNNFVEAHKSKPGFTFAFISKELLDVTLKTDVEDNDWKKVRNVIKDVGSLHILVAEDKVDGVALYQEAQALVPSDLFSELLSVRDGQTAVRIWIKEENDLVTDFVLLVGAPEDFALIHFYGNLDLSNIGSLAALFGSEQAEGLVRSSQQAKVNFSVSPNPGKGDFMIRYEADDDAPVSLSVTDQNGRQVANLQLNGLAAEQVNLEHLPMGTYWLQLQTKQGKIGVQQVKIVRYP
jgi:Domain of unknown function (DUF4252)/Secretion system C-terminal sorting domain